MAAAYRTAAPAEATALAFYLGVLAGTGAADESICESLLKAGFADLVTGPHQVPARKLFAAWLDRCRDPYLADTALDAALFTDLPEAVTVARRVAANPDATGRAAGTAVLLLWRHGAAGDLARLSALRADTRLFETTATGTPRECQVRDLAAAASLALRGQKVNDWFDLATSTVWWAGTGMKPVEIPVGFSKPEVREAALTKAWHWLDKQPGAPPAPKK
jgi:hypothetical protein